MPTKPSTDETALLARDGYAIVAGVLDDTACDALLAALPAAEITAPRRLLDAEPIARLARDLAAHPRIASLLPPGARALQCTCFDKSPAHNWGVGPHQDLSLPLPGEALEAPRGWRGASHKDGMLFAQPPVRLLEPIRAVRLQLDDAGDDGGGLEVIAGTHRNGRLDATQLAGLVDSAPRLACRVPRGGVLVMHPLLVHGSRRIRTAARRRVLHFVYAPADLFTREVAVAA